MADEVVVGARVVDRPVRMFVKDHGAGIPPGAKEKVFGRFSQLDSSDQRRTGGTGLGMNISREIVEAMGGRSTTKANWAKGDDLLCRSATRRTDGCARRDRSRRGRRDPAEGGERLGHRAVPETPHRQNGVTSGPSSTKEWSAHRNCAIFFEKRHMSRFMTKIRSAPTATPLGSVCNTPSQRVICADRYARGPSIRRAGAGRTT
jgi:hypothetical protein